MPFIIKRLETQYIFYDSKLLAPVLYFTDTDKLVYRPFGQS